MKYLTIILLVFPLLNFSVFAQTEVESYLEKARQFNKEQKFEDAANEITKAIALQPNDADLYLTRANYYLFLDKKAEILNDAQKAASLSPTDKKILYFSALILHKTQQHREALKISDALMALGDVDRFGWSLRVGIKTHLEDFAGAFEDVSTAIELFPQDAMLKQNQANLIRLMGNSEKALEMYNKLIAKYEVKFSKATDKNEKATLGRDLAMFLFSRAGIYFAKFDKEKAQADLIKAGEYEKFNQYNYAFRARIYKSQKMYPEALADLTAAIEYDKDDDDVTFLIDRGDVYFAMGRFAEAIQDYEQVIKLDEAQLKEMMQKRIALAKQKMQEK